MSDASTDVHEELEPDEQQPVEAQAVAGTDTESSDGEEEEEDEEGTDSEDDEDEAEAIARRLGAQLWADINKAHADKASSLQIPEPKDPKVEAAIANMKTILSFAEADFLVLSTMTSTHVAGLENMNVLELLRGIVESGSIAKDVAGQLSQTLVALARSEILFSPLPTVPLHPQAELQTHKRKRDERDDGYHNKRANTIELDLPIRLNDAARIITDALHNQEQSGQPIDPRLIQTIHHQLHQVFLFSLTSSVVGGRDMVLLRELSMLIQLLGVLTGTNIAPQIPHPSEPLTPERWAKLRAQNGAMDGHPVNDIGTAVFPCNLEGCRKIFSRLYSLRQHQRTHSTHRPYRCMHCPASFQRNHDLKRHIKGHDNRAWRCCGCDKIFSRRDAIKRHKDSPKKNPVCATAEAIEVEVPPEDPSEEVREERRAKLWTGVAVSAVVREDGLEDGEIGPEIIADAQNAVSHLHGLLRRVTSAFGAAGIAHLPHVPPAAPEQHHVVSAVPAHPPPISALPTSWPTSGAAAPLWEYPAMASLQPTSEVSNEDTPDSAGSVSLSNFGLNEDQAKLLEQAIATATAAAQAQAEAEALLEEEHEDDGKGEDKDQEEDVSMSEEE